MPTRHRNASNGSSTRPSQILSDVGGRAGAATALRRRAERGFTLIEVMVATAVMAIGLVSALQIFSSSMLLAGSSARQTEALVLARSLIDEAMWRAELVEESYNGEADEFGWSVEIFPIERSLVALDAGPGLGAGDSESEWELFAIRAVVTWQARGAEKQIELATARVSEIGL